MKYKPKFSSFSLSPSLPPSPPLPLPLFLLSQINPPTPLSMQLRRQQKLMWSQSASVQPTRTVDQPLVTLRRSHSQAERARATTFAQTENFLPLHNHGGKLDAKPTGTLPTTPKPVRSRPPGDVYARMTALGRGFLTRRLLQSEKVQSLIKTIQVSPSPFSAKVGFQCFFDIVILISFFCF